MSSILAMMFLVIFGSLAAAMAVVAQGNLRTADSSLKVSRAMSAAETGMVFAARRLSEETGRFVVEEGVIDDVFAEELWLGTVNPAEVTVLPPPGGWPGTPPSGIIQAVRDAHLGDAHSFIAEPGDATLPDLDDSLGILIVRPIALSTDPNAPFFRLRYELLDGVPMVRVTAEGIDGNITRVLQMDFQMDKKIEYAVLAPNRIMIGKNVMVEGPLGSLYGTQANELTTANGDPLVMRSDFYFLDATLDSNLDALYAQVALDDADGDSRLRVHHPAEGANLASVPELVDYDGDEYVDDFDLFMKHFDSDPTDGMVVYDTVLAAAAGLGSLNEELTDGTDTIDEQLARLIDEARPDRDGDGDVDGSDTGLGYQDGVIDGADLYGKMTGRLAFSIARAAWEAEHGGTYQSIVQGPIRVGIDEAPVTFNVPAEELLEITTSMFNDSQSWFEAQVPAASGAGLGGVPSPDPADLATGAEVAGTFTAAAASAWESVPFGSAGSYDHYQRPVYDGYTFRNIRIPMGNNGLFQNCTFIGVTFIESERACGDRNWNYAGAVETLDGGATYTPRFPTLPPQADIDAGIIVADTRTISNNIRFHDCTFLGSIAGDRLDEYTHWRNKVQITGATRFYIDPTDTDMLDQPDSATLLSALNSLTSTERTELSKSSILLPGWSVDVGNFDNQTGPTADVKLKGVIIAGILDVRGTADVHGTLLMTFRPATGAGPLSYGGQADAFNTTIGYFGPSDGDDEGVDPASALFEGFGEIRLRYNADALLPDGIPWPVRMDPVPSTYVEGGMM